MRLLSKSQSGIYSLTDNLISDIPPYVILSHRWGTQEVTFDDMSQGSGTNKIGWRKVAFCAEQGRSDGYEYFWLDTCCIDKSNNTELSEAINSMFRWYQNAAKCYVYLTDVTIQSEQWQSAFQASEWFARGWTLQELLAPMSVDFFSREGMKLGDKKSLERDIHRRTGIPYLALQGTSLSQFSFDEKFKWAESRQTTREEDKAYSLLGLFDVYIPLLYGEGKDNAIKRLKAEIKKESKASDQISLSIPRPTSTVPFRSDPDFVDRGDILDQIDRRCSRPAGRMALVGLGGVGKSQLAVRYAHLIRQRSPETWVFWTNASNVATVEAAYRDIANRLKLPGYDGPITGVLKLVGEWLANDGSGKWLIIIDNIDNVRAFQIEEEGHKPSLSMATLVPQSSNGAVLVTSRSLDVARELVGGDNDILDVGVMAKSEARLLLRKKLKHPSDGDEEHLVAALDNIPLAITQAAAYINRMHPRMSVSAYTRELNASAAKVRLLENAAADLRRDENASNSILATWRISFEQIRKERPSAADLLSFLSFFNPQSIPDSVVRRYRVDSRSQLIEQTTTDTVLDEADYDFEEDIAVLRSFSLVAAVAHTEEFEMHGLVQVATRVWLAMSGVEELWWQRFTSTMADIFPTGEYESWSTCQALLPHIQSIVEKKPRQDSISRKWTTVLANAAQYTWKQGLLVQAESLVRAALDEYERSLRSDEPDALVCVELLGLVLQYQGKYEEAELVGRRSLLGNKKKLGEEHPHTLTSMSNLAGVLRYQGKYNEAEQVNRKALEGYKKKLGDEDIHTLTSADNLAGVLQSQGKYEEAERVNRQALLGYREKLGENHPDTLTSVSNLAGLLYFQEKYKEAEQMNRKALEGRERILGKEHPDTLTSLSNLALVLQYQGDYDDAEQMNRRAIAGYEKQLGEDHPNTLTSLHCLAHLLAAQERFDEAVNLYRRAFTGFRIKLGAFHPTTTACARHLSALLSTILLHHL